MTEDEFWGLVERSRGHSPDPGRRLAWLEERLVRLPPSEIADFQVRQDETRLRSDTHALWGAAYLIMGGLCSMDAFWYFQPWLIGQGRRTFRLVTAVPDLLAELPGIRRLAGRPMGGWSDAEWPEWESLNYLAATAYERLTGDEDGLSDALLARGHETPCDTAPADPSWDFDDPAEIARRLPRLSALFPARARG
ncbi:hypothetical protein GCM10009527_038140 [Actinomadura nitritigenes]|uniref:DUF4240 domain-containing protein n=1 Tax=Actinomadura nitritigenes TaxID=134602 RepID=A0ABS3QSJ1_9ACTN|nr:DUF4240 domain-containing protein [Actinomadura nitritigenes]MBO2436448.1 DUF4240 domain-containing protein [Actinomadura nitritigenes]